MWPLGIRITWNVKCVGEYCFDNQQHHHIMISATCLSWQPAMEKGFASLVLDHISHDPWSGYNKRHDHPGQTHEVMTSLSPFQLTCNKHGVPILLTYTARKYHLLTWLTCQINRSTNQKVEQDIIILFFSDLTLLNRMREKIWETEKY